MLLAKGKDASLPLSILLPIRSTTAGDHTRQTADQLQFNRKSAGPLSIQRQAAADQRPSGHGYFFSPFQYWALGSSSHSWVGSSIRVFSQGLPGRCRMPQT